VSELGSGSGFGKVGATIGQDALLTLTLESGFWPIVASLPPLDTDGDGFGKACDGDFNNLHPVVNAFDLGQMRQALGKAVSDNTCPCDDGTLACSCAEFDLNGLHPVINALDLGIFRQMLGKPPGPAAP